MSDIGTFLGKIAGKIVNVANADRKLPCPDCKEITDHAAISLHEVVKTDTGYEDSHALYKAMGFVSSTVVDCIPFSFPLTFGNPYACVKCARIQWSGGAMSDHVNKT